MVLEGIKLQDPEARVEAQDDEDEGDEEEDPEDDDDPYVPLGDGIVGELATGDDGDGVFTFPGCYDGQHRHVGDIPTRGRRRLWFPPLESSVCGRVFSAPASARVLMSRPVGRMSGGVLVPVRRIRGRLRGLECVEGLASQVSGGGCRMAQDLNVYGDINVDGEEQEPRESLEGSKKDAHKIGRTWEIKRVAAVCGSWDRTRDRTEVICSSDGRHRGDRLGPLVHWPSVHRRLTVLGWVAHSFTDNRTRRPRRRRRTTGRDWILDNDVRVQRLQRGRRGQRGRAKSSCLFRRTGRGSRGRGRQTRRGRYLE